MARLSSTCPCLVRMLSRPARRTFICASKRDTSSRVPVRPTCCSTRDRSSSVSSRMSDRCTCSSSSGLRPAELISSGARAADTYPLSRASSDVAFAPSAPSCDSISSARMRDAFSVCSCRFRLRRCTGMCLLRIFRLFSFSTHSLHLCFCPCLDLCRMFSSSQLLQRSDCGPASDTVW